MTDEKKSEVVSTIIDGLTVMMSNSPAGYAHMNNRQFETLYIGRPGGSCWYIINCGTTEQHNPIPQGKSRRLPPCGQFGEFTKSFVRSVQQVENDDAFCRLIYQFTVNKDDTEEISIRAKKARTNFVADRTNEKKRGKL